ncbi:paeninodin family lasso peptide [Mesobacillus foraminis]
MKKEWQKPELEVLSINMTMLGANNGGVDFYVKDPFDNEEAFFHS